VKSSNDACISEQTSRAIFHYICSLFSPAWRKMYIFSFLHTLRNYFCSILSNFDSFKILKMKLVDVRHLEVHTIARRKLATCGPSRIREGL
jgi:hypothetical protein